LAPGSEDSLEFSGEGRTIFGRSKKNSGTVSPDRGGGKLKTWWCKLRFFLALLAETTPRLIRPKEFPQGYQSGNESLKKPYL